MGFKRIKEFNVALLGKQVWRVSTDPNSFVARLLKARYFKSSSIFNASVGSNPSYVWRSMLAARDLITKGAVLRVGNGESINAWDDPWIPNINDNKVCTPMVIGLENAKVSSLLNLEENVWDVNFLRDVFYNEDVERILKIHISSSHREDKWM